MTPADALAQHRKMIGQIGEDIAVRRFTGTGDSRTSHDTVTRGRVLGYAPNPLAGSVVSGDRRVIALVDTLAGILPITTNDALVIRGKECKIKAVDDNTRRIAGVLIALEIQAGG